MATTRCNRPKVYISGPITIGNRNSHFYQANEAQRLLMLSGFAPLNPMQSITLPFAWEKDFTHNVWIETDLPWVEVADAVLRLPGESKGADEEVAHAENVGVPVFHTVGELEDHFIKKTTNNRRLKKMVQDIFANEKCDGAIKEDTGGTSCCKDAAELSPTPSPITTLMDTHDRLTIKAKAIMEAKNSDYTCGSGDPFANFRASEAVGVSPVQGILMRMMDKLQRARSFDSMGELQVKSEPVEDICMDIINYAVLLRGLLAEKETVDKD